MASSRSTVEESGQERESTDLQAELPNEAFETVEEIEALLSDTVKHAPEPRRRPER